MPEDTEMLDPFSNTNFAKRKNDTQGDFREEFAQSDSRSALGAAESIRKRRKVEIGTVPDMIDYPLVQAGALFAEGHEELEGNLIVPGQPILSGGYAKIYLGIWRSSDGTLMDVAVKTLKAIRPTSITCKSDAVTLQQRREKRLKREVAVWTRIIHPNIHPLLGYRTQPEPCLVSPWCQNGNLVNYLDNNPNLSEPEKLQLVIQTARGLVYLHSQSPPICHSDLKPENVLVNDLCEATLSDFGLSRIIREPDGPTGLSTGAGPKGSHNYMAPELFEEENSKPTLETDVYAFGGLTLAVMSGTPPFAHLDSPGKVMFRILTGSHPRSEEHPSLEPNDPLWPLMIRCWAREPQIRPLMSAVQAELKTHKNHVTSQKFPESCDYPVPRFPTLIEDTDSSDIDWPNSYVPWSSINLQP